MMELELIFLSSFSIGLISGSTLVGCLIVRESTYKDVPEWLVKVSCVTAMTATIVTIASGIVLMISR